MFKLKFIAAILGFITSGVALAEAYSNDIYMYRDKKGQMVLTDVKTEGAKLVSKGVLEKPEAAISSAPEPKDSKVVMEITTAKGKKVISPEKQ